MNGLKGVLVDITRCIGCASCAVACKMWNKLDYDAEKPAAGQQVKLNDKNWTVVRQYEAPNQQGQPVWRFVKQQCLHCVEPACVSACFSRALQKNADGAVVYYPDLCVGCRYCMIACPFDAPKYEWSKAAPQIAKCQFCSTRLEQGEAPACTSVCPTGAVEFGEREELLQVAQKRIKDGHYVKKIYGQEEVGGTCWLYISDMPFEELGFRCNVGKVPLPSYTHRFLKNTPFIALGWGMLLTAMSVYISRRKERKQEEEEEA